MNIDYLITAGLSLLPVSELRGAIPYAYFSGIPLFSSFVISVLSNMLVPLIGFVFFATLHKVFLSIPIYRRFFENTLERTRKKIQGKVEKYGIWGLMLFVAIPLPITGAWTGTLGAWILGLDKKKSTLAIMAGVLISGVIVSLIILTGKGINSIFVKL